MPDKDRLISWESDTCPRRKRDSGETLAQLILYHGCPPIRRRVVIPPTHTYATTLDLVFVVEAVAARKWNLQTFGEHFYSFERRGLG